MKFPASSLTLAALAGISLVTPAFAVVSIDYVTVGNAGNAADFTFDPAGYGAVAYTYQIGKYEVTNAQYADFLNAANPTGANANGIYNTNMGDKPVNYVSWYDAARFSNWRHNGQGVGSAETGA